MQTVSEIVETEIRRMAFLEEGINRNLVNISELARVIKPKVEKKLVKEVSLGSLIMAIKRINIARRINLDELNKVWTQFKDINVKSNILEYGYLNKNISKTTISKLFNLFADNQSEFIALNQGVYETAVIVVEEFGVEIEKVFSDISYEKYTNLSSITVTHAFEGLKIPGVYYSILKQLAWEGINVDEFITTFDEFTIILDNTYVEKAFSALRKLKEQAKNT